MTNLISYVFIYVFINMYLSYVTAVKPCEVSEDALINERRSGGEKRKGCLTVKSSDGHQANLNDDSIS